MMLIMLTPGLACASGFCYMPERPHHVKSAQPPCHHMDHGSEQMAKSQGDRNGKCRVMFLADCAGIDLQTASPGGDISGPDIPSGKLLTLDGLTLLPVADFSPLSINAIRAPPPQRLASDIYQPSIILTTQRLRI